MANRYDYENATIRISKVDVSEVLNNLEKFGPATKKAVLNYLDSWTDELEFWMRNTRPWQDRTFRAKNNLRARTVDRSDYVGLILSHNVEYGKYLEYGTKHAKAYPILQPTKEKYFPEIVRGMKGLLRNKRWMRWM